MRTHRLKVLPEFFAALLDGSKTFEIRKDDRGFMVGDMLFLCEWDPGADADHGPGPSDALRYTGREMERVVTYKFAGGRHGIPEGVCVLGLGQK